jgi:hypothetical protein
MNVTKIAVAVVASSILLLSILGCMSSNAVVSTQGNTYVTRGNNMYRCYAPQGARPYCVEVTEQ